MHYKNGREAKVGDRVVSPNPHGNPIAGVLVNVQAGANSCNGRIVGEPALSRAHYVTLGECLHADDVMATPAGVVPDMSKGS